MRHFLLLSFGFGVGCGGAVAPDTFGDAATDSSVVSDGGGTDTSTTTDSTGPPTEIGVPDAPPPGCPLLHDACFAGFLAEAQKAADCMAHPDTCAASGGKDASGCGHRTPTTGGGESCTWPDGAKTFDSSGSGGAINAKGETCYKYSLASSGGIVDVTVAFPDGATYVEHITSPGTTGEIVIVCPDGTKSPSFTSDESAACGIAVTCCSSRTPPSCSG